MPPTNLEIAKDAIDDFKEIQEYMLLARIKSYQIKRVQGLSVSHPFCY